MFSLLKKHKVLLVLAIIFSVVLSAATIGAAFILENILNSVVNGDWELFRKMIWVVVIYIVALMILVSLSAFTEKKLIVNTIRDFRADVQNGIMNRDTVAYKKTNSADYISSLTNDIKIVEENALVPLLNSIQAGTLFILASIALFRYSPLIGGVLMGFLVLMYALPASLGKPIGKRQEAYSMSLAGFTIKLKDQFMGYEVIRSFQLKNQVNERFEDENRNLASRKFGVDKLLAISEGIAQVIAAGSQIGTMLIAGVLVFQGHMAAGALLAILQLSGAFVQPVSMVMQYIPMIQGAKPVVDRLKTLSEPMEPDFSGTSEAVYDNVIQFKDVSFGYSPENKVLNDLNVSIEHGKKYVIAGESGGGKSTLVRLLGAEFSDYSGEITIDGKELHDVNVDELLAKIATIHQGVYMFDETIKDNIDLHRAYTNEEWIRALKLSGVNKFIDKIDGRLDAPVGEGGGNLSGGQRQRIAVARALIEGKPILILDEGTSAVDVQTAYDIESSLLEIPDLTMITITHNFHPELLKRYDSIIYMAGGRVAEQGSYEELANKKGKFQKFMTVDA
jgi:ABC-type multidrug transport system fused ATPase/permease subunit